QQINPRLIYVAASGWGQTGPYAQLAGLDIMAQAMSGLMSITGPEGGEEPVKVGVPICDLVCALYGALAAVAALQARERDGPGPAQQPLGADPPARGRDKNAAGRLLDRRPPGGGSALRRHPGLWRGLQRSPPRRPAFLLGRGPPDARRRAPGRFAHATGANTGPRGRRRPAAR